MPLPSSASVSREAVAATYIIIVCFVSSSRREKQDPSLNTSITSRPILLPRAALICWGNLSQRAGSRNMHTQAEVSLAGIFALDS